jgi:hypothetical protein
MHGVIRHDNIFRKDLTLAGRDLIKVCARALMAGAARLNLHNSSAAAHAALTCDFIRHAGGRSNERTDEGSKSALSRLFEFLSLDVCAN